MNDNEKYIEEFVNDIPFDTPNDEHRDELKNQLIVGFESDFVLVPIYDYLLP